MDSRWFGKDFRPFPDHSQVIAAVCPPWHCVNTGLFDQRLWLFSPVEPARVDTFSLTAYLFVLNVVEDIFDMVESVSVRWRSDLNHLVKKFVVIRSWKIRPQEDYWLNFSCKETQWKNSLLSIRPTDLTLCVCHLNICCQVLIPCFLSFVQWNETNSDWGSGWKYHRTAAAGSDNSTGKNGKHAEHFTSNMLQSMIQTNYSVFDCLSSWFVLGRDCNIFILWTYFETKVCF